MQEYAGHYIGNNTVGLMLCCSIHIGKNTAKRKYHSLYKPDDVVRYTKAHIPESYYIIMK